MSNHINLWDTPTANDVYLIAGWRQWADAGAISSALPEYLIDLLSAEKIGEINSEDFYLFQVPGTHHLLRPVINLENGYRQSMKRQRNEIYYAGDDDKGVVIFLGDEPHLYVDKYADHFLQMVDLLNVKRVVAVGGVYGPLPYDKERDISCIYSLRPLRHELEAYSVRFSDYEGGATIGSYIMHKAEAADVEFIVFYSFVPAYDFAQPNILPQGMRIEQDYKAWYDVMRRINHMFALSLNLAPLEEKSQMLLDAMDEKIDELESEYPQLNAREYLDAITAEYQERPFSPLDHIWAEEIDDIFRDLDE